MNILVIGGGGREHSLGWKLKQSSKCEALYFAPGNAGTASLGENVDLNIKSNETVVEFAKKKNIGLVVVAPDDYLAQGMVDALSAEGIPAFGATKAASRLEWSKAFSKDFMVRHGIPTAQSKTFTDFDEASEYVKTLSAPIVVKADGLALGKGVVIAESVAEAESALKSFMEDAQFGESGKTVVVEEFLSGSEVSTHAFCDGTTAKMFPVSRDHKRIGDGNTGLNTGGMGTIAPLETPESFLETVSEKVVMPTVAGMRAENAPFAGILYPGLMVSKDGSFKVLEYNARFGDPECESYMRILKTDLVDIMLACVNGTLAEQEVSWTDDSVVTVILASKGYPEKYEKGFAISGIEEAEKDSAVVVFHAGTALNGGSVVTNGGRVLAVSAVGKTPEEAKEKAYEAAGKISFNGKQNRADIGAFWGI